MVEVLLMGVEPEYILDEKLSVPRTEYIQLFNDKVASLGQQKYSVLNFYGNPGIGKSELLKQLGKELNESPGEILWASTDLSDIAGRTVSTFLVDMRDQLSAKYSLDFEFFNIAHAIYWKKVHPEIVLRDEIKYYAKKESVTQKIIGVLDKFPPIEWARYIADIVKSLPESIRVLWRKYAYSPTQLSDMTFYEIEEILPSFFSISLKMELKERSNDVVIFMDTYDFMWKDKSDTFKFKEKDRWLWEKLIPNLDNEKILWVICGRQEIQWEKIDEDWNFYIEKKEVDGFDKGECIEYLEDYCISDGEIQKRIFSGSQRIPLYLYLSVKVYHKIKDQEERIPNTNDFERTPDGIFNSFMKYHENEIDTMEVLSIPHFWDQNLFEKLVTEFKTGFSLSDNSYSNLHGFSFISKIQDEVWKFHNLMRESIYERMDSELKYRVHFFLAEHYSSKVEQIDIKSISEEQKIALKEGYYHVKNSSTPEKLFEWFIQKAKMFHKAALWSSIEPLYEDLNEYLEKNLGLEHDYVSATMNNLAALNDSVGNYEEALSLYKRALDISEKNLGHEHPHIATTLNNLAKLHGKMDNCEEALSLYKRAISIFEKNLGSEDPYVAIALNNLAGIHESMGNYEEALLLCERALKIHENNYGPEHPHIATTLNILSWIYGRMDNYEEALSTSKRVLDIYENNYGFEHPHVAVALSNLAGIYESMGNYEETVPLCKRALSIFVKNFGPGHPYVITTLNNIAGMHETMGNYEEAFLLRQLTNTIAK